MGKPFLDDAELRVLLERALVSEPPLGPVVRGAVRAGVRRRRRRVAGVAAGLIVVAAAAISVPGLTARPVTVPVTPPSRATVYVANLVSPTAWVARIPAATNRLGAHVPVGPWVDMLAVTPDGKTAYVASDGPGKSPGTATPIDIATQTARAAIRVAAYPDAIAITPDGRTAYVSSGSGSVTPIDIRTQKARAAIRVGASRRRW
jgi:DNA-binding beta-propeller fold protein YncE